MYGAPVLKDISKVQNQDRVFEALMGKYRESSVKRYLGYWQGFRKWVSWTSGKTVPTSPLELVDYLYAREEEGLGPSVPLAISKSVAWFEELAGIERGSRIMENHMVTMVVQELTKKLESKAPPVRRAPRIVSCFIPAMEEMVMDEATPVPVRIAAWIKLVKIWGLLRFSDMVHLQLSTVRWYEGNFTATLMRTKSTGAGKRVRHLPLYVSRGCWVAKHQWLRTGYELLVEEGPEKRVHLVNAGFYSGGMRNGELLSYAEMVAASSEVLSRMVTRKGEVILPEGWDRFWTEHSERSTLASGLAALGVPKSERDMLGRWNPEGSDQYVRTYNVAVRRMQLQMVEVIKSGEAHVELDEGAIAAELVEYLAVDWNVDRDNALNAVAAWKNKMGMFEKQDGDPAPRAPVERGEESLSGSENVPRGEENEAGEVPARKMRKLLEERSGGFVVVFNRIGRGMLHKIGRGGCWMARRREFKRCEQYELEPPDSEFSSKCKLCWPKRADDSSGSTSDTEDEVEVPDEGSEALLFDSEGRSSALEGFSPSAHAVLDAWEEVP